MKIFTDTTKEHEKEMEELLRQLQEERRCSSSLKDRMSILQQELCDAQSSTQVNFQMQPLLKLDSTTTSKLPNCIVHLNSGFLMHNAWLLCVFTFFFLP